jgi:amino acid adenylation domain-containing protein
MAEGERARVLAFGRGASPPYERNATIHELFTRQAAQTPGAIAVTADAGSLTYAELDRRSNRLANYLRSLGVGTGTSVGIALERTIDLPVGLLGILKAGAAYVPLDRSYPPGRLSFMVDDAAVTLVVSDAASRPRLAACGAHVVAIDADGPAIDALSAEAPPVAGSPDAVAYVIYTSGSTGRAKGVAVPHRGPVRLVRKTNFVDFAPDDAILQLAPVAFDASTFEIWGALLNGARLAIPRRGLFAPDELGAMIVSFGVTTLFLTPSLFMRVVEDGSPAFGRLRRILVGGDVVPPDYARRFIAAHPNCRFMNGYGPTENTTFSTTYEVPSPGAIATYVPIGRPIAHSTAYVLDRHLEPAPIGVPGELCVGGDGIARGYVGLAELTAERFVRDPFSDVPGARLYRTGDRVRWRDDGCIEFLGRTDNQVKIRGFRIELGEIESSLAANPHVRDVVVVVAQHETEKLLVAFVVPANDANLDERGLRSFLAERVPGYMIPHRFVVLDGLPEHASGKVDRVALGVLAQTVAQTRTPVGSAPRAAAAAAPEAAIAELWRDILGLNAAPDVDQNFFDLGGDSLRLLRMHTLLNERLGTSIGVMDLFEHTTIRKLAAFAGRRRSA